VDKYFESYMNACVKIIIYCFKRRPGSGPKEDGITEWWREVRSEEQNNMKSERKFRKFHPRRKYKSTEWKYRHNSTLSLTSVLDGAGGQRQAPAALPPWIKPGIHSGPQCWSGNVQKISAPAGFVPRTVNILALRAIQKML